jgi:hypothetical protein
MPEDASLSLKTPLTSTVLFRLIGGMNLLLTRKPFF